ncbi:MAG TPA: DUF3137 domain-containing protein [Opitutales bacterium]|jgi:hypothetical protein|nr:DUF3137 domain-containing protein [Opitutales bacterium]
MSSITPSFQTPSAILAVSPYSGSDIAWFIGMGAFLITALVSMLRKERRRKNLSNLAERLGFQLQNPGAKIRLVSVEGRHRGHEVRFLSYFALLYAYYVFIGDKRRSNIAVAVSYAGRDGFCLYLYPNIASLRRVVTMRTKQAQLLVVKTGDDAFDRAYFVLSNDPVLGQSVLTPKIRGQLLALDTEVQCRSNLAIEDGTVIYPLLGAFRNVAQVSTDTITSMLDFVCGLAEQIEKHP